MKWAKWILISLGLLGIVGLISCLVYGEGYTNGMEAGLGGCYTLRDPTYEEAVAFLKEDKTDENEYDCNHYECSHFAKDVCNNVESKGLRCAFVRIIFPRKAHAIIAFNTIDKGLVYFDPEVDWRVEPVIGKRYCQCVDPEPGYRCKKPALDDTITDILVIW